MRRTSFSFLTSAVDLDGCPQDNFPEVALAGRSNAGKSSFINALAGSKMARVSSAPGKTRLLNFFQASSGYRLVDMPGYGYAKGVVDDSAGWAGMIEPYLAARANLAGILVLMDVRRHWASEERDLLSWTQPIGIPAAVVLTKSDKLTRSDALKASALAIRAAGTEDVYLTSALKKTGYLELEDFVYQTWIKPRLEARP